MPKTFDIRLQAWTEPPSSAATLLYLGRRGSLQQLPPPPGLDPQTWKAMLEATPPGDFGAATSTWVGSRQIALGLLPEACGRHNSPSRAWAIPDLVRRALRPGELAILAALEEPSHAAATLGAIARALPAYTRTSREPATRAITISLLGPQGPIEDPGLEPLLIGVREAARLVDMPASELHTDALVAEAQAIAQQLGCRCTLIRGPELDARGYGGLWSVGRAATRPPALVALHHEPPGATRSVAWVGKGIVYDTGGLCLKAKTSMPGMKNDMGGAAAVLQAFRAAVLRGHPQRLTAVLCVAENAIGPEATRPDDIIQLRSGRTVEVNNTDAEGRLVLADGVAWAAESVQPDTIIDLATLTGAAPMSTGKLIAAIYSNEEELEAAACRAGRAAGEPVFPLPYAPELYRREFKSAVADMKNSVKDRNNAQSACAAQFIAAHLPHPAPRWLHVDIAGTATDGEGRGTGFGVGLLLELAQGH